MGAGGEATGHPDQIVVVRGDGSCTVRRLVVAEQGILDGKRSAARIGVSNAAALPGSAWIAWITPKAHERRAAAAGPGLPSRARSVAGNGALRDGRRATARDAGAAAAVPAIAAVAGDIKVGVAAIPPAARAVLGNGTIAQRQRAAAGDATAVPAVSTVPAILAEYIDARIARSSIPRGIIGHGTVGDSQRPVVKDAAAIPATRACRPRSGAIVLHHTVGEREDAIVLDPTSRRVGGGGLAAADVQVGEGDRHGGRNREHAAGTAAVDGLQGFQRTLDGQIHLRRERAAERDRA
jgi:hypothetical protein